MLSSLSNLTREQYKPEARKISVNRTESHLSDAPPDNEDRSLSRKKPGRMGVYSKWQTHRSYKQWR